MTKNSSKQTYDPHASLYVTYLLDVPIVTRVPRKKRAFSPNQAIQLHYLDFWGYTRPFYYCSLVKSEFGFFLLVTIPGSI